MPQNIFKIHDGRNTFWQWDTGQKLIVLDDSIDQVHFSTKDMTHALVTEVYEDNDGIRVCNIPDIILTLPKNLVAYAYVLDSDKTKTIRSVKFPVTPRPIPDNYISNQNDEIEDLTNRVVLLEKMLSDTTIADTDKTLSLVNRAADAGAVGEALKLKANKEDIIQSDWNQADKTAIDFIKNKPDVIISPSNPREGQVLSIGNGGNKTWTTPLILDYTYGYKYQENDNSVLFCVNVSNPQFDIFRMPSKRVVFAIYKDDIYVDGSKYSTMDSPIELRVKEANDDRVVIYLDSGDERSLYFYYFSTNSWTKKVAAYSADTVDWNFIGFNNTKEYTPINDYNPATKKYVDDIVANIDTNGYNWHTLSATKNKFTYEYKVANLPDKPAVLNWDTCLDHLTGSYPTFMYLFEDLDNVFGNWRDDAYDEMVVRYLGYVYNDLVACMENGILMEGQELYLVVNTYFSDIVYHFTISSENSMLYVAKYHGGKCDSITYDYINKKIVSDGIDKISSHSVPKYHGAENANKVLFVDDTGYVALMDIASNVDVPHPDWNQSDDTAADYILNRTHYYIPPITKTGDSEMVQYDSNTTTSWFISDSNPVDIDLISGNNYILQATFYDSDGNVVDDHDINVESTAYNYNGKPTLGSSDMLAGIEPALIDGTQRWCYGYIDSGTIDGVNISAGYHLMIQCTGDVVRAAISITSKEGLHQLDEKWIPDSIARKVDAIQTPNYANIGQTIVVASVDENGKPTGWEAVDLLESNVICINNIELLAEAFGHYSIVFVSDYNHSFDGVEWTGTLMITKGPQVYASFDFSAIDSAGKCFTGNVHMQNQSVFIQEVENNKPSSTTSRSYITLVDHTTGEDYVVYMNNGSLVSELKSEASIDLEDTESLNGGAI